MTIHIEALTFDVIIGLLDFERKNPQQIIIDLEATYIYKENIFINYAELVSLIQLHLKEKRYELLEDAILGLKSLIISSYPSISTLSLKIAKPNILPQCSVALSQRWKF